MQQYCTMSAKKTALIREDLKLKNKEIMKVQDYTCPTKGKLHCLKKHQCDNGQLSRMTTCLKLLLFDDANIKICMYACMHITVGETGRSPIWKHFSQK